METKKDSYFNVFDWCTLFKDKKGDFLIEARHPYISYKNKSQTLLVYSSHKLFSRVYLKIIPTQW